MPCTTMNMHHREEDIFLMKTYYELKMQVQDPGLKKQGARPVQKMRVPDPGLIHPH